MESDGWEGENLHPTLPLPAPFLSANGRFGARAPRSGRIISLYYLVQYVCLPIPWEILSQDFLSNFVHLWRLR